MTSTTSIVSTFDAAVAESECDCASAATPLHIGMAHVRLSAILKARFIFGPLGFRLMAAPVARGAVVVCIAYSVLLCYVTIPVKAATTFSGAQLQRKLGEGFAGLDTGALHAITGSHRQPAQQPHQTAKVDVSLGFFTATRYLLIGDSRSSRTMQTRRRKPQSPDPMRPLTGYALRRASSAAMAEVAGNLRPLGLRPVEASVLLVIRSKPGATQSDIGRLLNILRANMTPLAIGLERGGLVRREKTDGRSRGLVLTEKGNAMAAKVQKAFESSDRSMTERVPKKYREAFVAALYALWDSYEAERGPDELPSS